ncbi:hypothetical protein [Parasphingorhabdus sp.]|uniref:hypothetical protein n=1 Tax=Parasphingorhabdus sp. TaxID=2709688 RepID=UPI0032641606
MTARIFLATYLLSVFLADITLQWIGRMHYPKSWDLFLGFYGFPQMLLADTLRLYLESPLLSSFVALIAVAALIWLLSYTYRQFARGK